MPGKPASRPVQDEDRRRLHEALAAHGMLPMVEKPAAPSSGTQASKPADPASTPRAV
jgi:hypothetical protein